MYSKDIREVVMNHGSKHEYRLVMRTECATTTLFFVYRGPHFGTLQQLYGTYDLHGSFLNLETLDLEQCTIEAHKGTPCIEIEESNLALLVRLLLVCCIVPIITVFICPRYWCGPDEEMIQRLKDFVDSGNKWVDDSLAFHQNQQAEQAQRQADLIAQALGQPRRDYGGAPPIPPFSFNAPPQRGNTEGEGERLQSPGAGVPRYGGL